MKRLILAALALVSAAAAQPYYNLDFEVVTRNRLRGWSLNAAGYELAPDNTTSTSGRYSMRIRSTAANAQLGPTAILLDPAPLLGKRVKVSGQIRTENVAAPGYAAIWLRVDGPGGILSLNNMSEVGIRGTTGWRRYEYELNVNPAGQQIVFGAFLAGQGVAWFDDIRVEVDGQPIPQGPMPSIGEPDEDQLNWVRQNAIRFETERAESGFADLQPLEQLIGSARVVGLGEATHGTAEFFRMKHRLTEFLATQMGFTIFSIEANMPESYRLNDYVMAGRGDPRELLKGMYFWTWNTQEVLDMIEWMRKFNQSGRGRIQFTGFDMQVARVAQQIVRDFVAKADAAFLPELDAAWEQVSRVAPMQLTAVNRAAIESASVAAQSVRTHLEAAFNDLVKTYPMAEVEWAVQNARVVEQATFVKIGGSLHRDEMMAANTQWILQQNPGAKMAIWAHNYHVSRVRGAQGSYLSQQYGNEYVVLGFAFHEGRYSAINSAGRLVSDNVGSVSFPGSVEYVFHQTGLPRFILDLRNARPGHPGSSWLLADNEFREVGALALDGFSVRSTLTRDYDALIFFDQTTPSALLPF